VSEFDWVRRKIWKTS